MTEVPWENEQEEAAEPEKEAEEVKKAKPESHMTNPDVDLSEKIGEKKTASELLDAIIDLNENDFLPWEEIQLPSKGYFYDNKLPDGMVRVKPMGIHADKILATQRIAASGQSLDYLFEHCVQLTEDMDPSELLTGDRMYLLYVLRGITHGNEYEFVLKCPNCEETSAHKYDLNELASTIRWAKETDEEPFKVKLPYMSSVLKRNVWVKVRFIRGKDTQTMMSRKKFSKRVKSVTQGTTSMVKTRKDELNDMVERNLAQVIVAFGGDGIDGEVTDKARIKGLVDRMHAKDTGTIREELRTKSPGIDSTIAAECTNCGHSMTTQLPITESFFRPAGD